MAYQRYPFILWRGDVSRTVMTEAEEAEAVADGFGRWGLAPVTPAPVEAPEPAFTVPVDVPDELDALPDGPVDEPVKRKRGRPPKVRT